jgi:hypothetical protein
MGAPFEPSGDVGWLEAILVGTSLLAAAALARLITPGAFHWAWRKIVNGYWWIRYHGQRTRRSRTVDGATGEFRRQDPLGGAFEFDALVLRYDCGLKQGEALAERIERGLRVTVSGPELANFYAGLKKFLYEHAWFTASPVVIDPESTAARALKCIRVETVIIKTGSLLVLRPFLKEDEAALRQDREFCRWCRRWKKIRSDLQKLGRSLNEYMYDTRLRGILFRQLLGRLYRDDS